MNLKQFLSQHVGNKIGLARGNAVWFVYFTESKKENLNATLLEVHDDYFIVDFTFPEAKTVIPFSRIESIRVSYKEPF